jgi:hypothetical protein
MHSLSHHPVDGHSGVAGISPAMGSAAGASPQPYLVSGRAEGLHELAAGEHVESIVITIIY